MVPALKVHWFSRVLTEGAAMLAADWSMRGRVQSGGRGATVIDTRWTPPPTGSGTLLVYHEPT